jgi:hypothetical protein
MYISYSHFAAYKFLFAFCRRHQQPICAYNPLSYFCTPPSVLISPWTPFVVFCSAVVLFFLLWSPLFKNIYTFAILPKHHRHSCFCSFHRVLYSMHYYEPSYQHSRSCPSPFFVLCSPNSPFIHCFYTYIHDSCFLACIDIFARFPWFYCVHLFLPE